MLEEFGYLQFEVALLILQKKMILLILLADVPKKFKSRT